MQTKIEKKIQSIQNLRNKENKANCRKLLASCKQQPTDGPTDQRINQQIGLYSLFKKKKKK